MRIVKVTSYYSQFLDYYYNANPQIKSNPFDVQYNHLMEQCFGWSDFFKKNFELFGHEAFEIVWNAKPLQDAWEKEHCKSNVKNILFEQLVFLKPDIVIFQDSVSFSDDFIREIKKEVPSIKSVVGFLCSPYNASVVNNLKVYDLVLACEPFLEYLKYNGIKCEKFIHGFEGSILNKIQTTKNAYSSDFIFIGSLISGTNFHRERIEILDNLINRGIKLDIYAPLIANENYLGFLTKKYLYYIYQYFTKIGLEKTFTINSKLNKISLLSETPERAYYSKRLLKRINNIPLFGLEMYSAIAGSKIGFNFHGGIAGNFAANVRMFEVTGVGTVLLTDHKKNIGELFDPDYEIVTYKSSEECVEKTEWLLEHPRECKEIALAGQRRCLKSHSIKHRAEQILKYLRI